MEYTTDTLEQRITINGLRYVYDLVVDGFAKYEDDTNYTSFSNVYATITNLTKYGKEIESLEIESEIKFKLESDLEDILRENGYCN